MKRWGILLAGAGASAALLALDARVSGASFVVGFVALVPWFIALGRARSVREALGAGWVMSVAFVAGVFSWLPGAVERYAGGASPWPWVLLVALAPILEPQFLTFAVVRHLLSRSAPGFSSSPAPWATLRAAFAGAAAYVGTELVANKLLFDTLGQGLYPSRVLRQGADLVGVHGLTLLLLVVNEALAVAVVRMPRLRAALMPMAGAAALVAGAFVYGWIRCTQLDAQGTQGDASGIVVGVVQANITNYDKLRAEQGAFGAVRAILDAHGALSGELRQNANPDVIVWPETVYPTTFGSPKSDAGAALDAELLASAEATGTPLVFGGYDSDAGGEYNAAFFVSSAGVRAYRKGLLFPFTERVPPLVDSSWLRERLPWTGHWTQGPGPETMPMKLRDGRSMSVVPLICYDALSPEFVAKAANRGADLIVTLSNDSWFPDARAPRLHLVSAAFRSIETRLPQVRATNSGISAVISPAGDLMATAGWNERSAFSGRVPTPPSRFAPAVHLVPWLGPALSCAALFLLLAERIRAKGEAPRMPAPAQSTPGGKPARRAGERRVRARARSK